MIRDESTSSESSWSSSRSWRASDKVLAIDCVKGTSRAEEWSGDIVEEIEIGNLILRAPFKDGKSGVHRHLHSHYKNKFTDIRVRVRRGSALNDWAVLQACIVPHSRKKNRYILRPIHDPDYAVSFFDRTLSQCLQLQASKASRLSRALDSAQFEDDYVAYPWDRKMQSMLPVPNSSSIMSILFLPTASPDASGHFHDLEHTLARANAWFYSAQLSGVPIVLRNIQTETLLTKISGETASCMVNTSSLSDLPNLVNASLYGFEDYHGVDMGIVRAIRLWFCPIEEYPVVVDVREGDVKLGFVISRTEEGFVYVSSVLEGDDEEVPSERSGLGELYRDATRDSKLLVISRVNNQKVLPWIVTSTGTIRCFDTASLCQKMSLHRHAQVPVVLHVLMCDFSSLPPRRHRDSRPPPPAMSSPTR